MFHVLNRFAVVLSVIVGFLVAYFFCGFERYPTEAFFEFGWVIFLISAAIARATFLSRSFVESALSEARPAEDVRVAGETGVQKSSVSEIDELRAEESAPAVAVASVRSAMQSVHAEDSAPEIEKPNAIVEFFSDRPLAKIGGILLFLGAVFFLSLVWQEVGPVGKILIGLMFGFSLYAIGVWMDKRGHVVESRTLLGVGIAINALTILSGRWMIGGTEGYLSDTVTMGFLVLNTLFAVVTALVYSSRTFLLFSFAFGYVIPFVVGAVPR